MKKILIIFLIIYISLLYGCGTVEKDNTITSGETLETSNFNVTDNITFVDYFSDLRPISAPTYLVGSYGTASAENTIHVYSDPQLSNLIRTGTTGVNGDFNIQLQTEAEGYPYYSIVYITIQEDGKLCSAIVSVDDQNNILY